MALSFGTSFHTIVLNKIIIVNAHSHNFTDFYVYHFSKQYSQSFSIGTSHSTQIFDHIHLDVKAPTNN